MKMITKLAGAALALCIAGSQYTGGAAELPPAAGLYQAFTTTGDSLYHPFAVGPGVINLSPADSLADRQWALRNNGRIRRTESRLMAATLTPWHFRPWAPGTTTRSTPTRWRA